MRYSATRIVVLMCIGSVSVVGFGQCGSINRNSAVAVDHEVNRIFNEALDHMQYTLPSGVKAMTWMPPDDSVRDQIKCLGAAGVPAIAALVRSSHRSFGSILSIRMLGWAEVPEIIPPLAEVLSSSNDSLKLEALESLAAAPPDKALLVIQKVLHSEKNPEVLGKAAKVAARLEGAMKD